MGKWNLCRTEWQSNTGEDSMSEASLSHFGPLNSGACRKDPGIVMEHGRVLPKVRDALVLWGLILHVGA